MADLLSRNYSDSDADLFFTRENLPPKTKLSNIESDFELIADW